MMYEFADGMFADEPGLLRTRGEVREVATLGSGLGFPFYSRGGIAHTRLCYQANAAVVIVPTAVYEVKDNGQVTPKMTPVAAGSFSGSHARLGDNLFLGCISQSVYTATWAGRHDQVSDSYTNNAGFKAAFVAAKAEKMWRVDGGVALGISLSWTDDTPNATPIFSTPYTFRTGRPQPRDLGILGPHGVVAVFDESSGSGQLVAVDAGGMLTPVLDDLPPLNSFVPFLGGHLLIPSGGLETYWLQDITGYRVVSIGGPPRGRAEMGFLAVRRAAGPITGSYPATRGREMFLPLYGTFTKRDGSSVNGSAIVQGILGTEGFNFHTLATPEGMSGLTNAHVMAMHLHHRRPTSASGGAPPATLRAVVAQENASNSSQSDVKLYAIEMSRGTGQAASYDAAAKFLRTSRYVGDDWTTKQEELLRGYVTQIPDNSSVVVRVYLDGDSNETYNFSVNSAGPVAQSLPPNIIGRDVALDFETNANGAVVIEAPWSLDYFAVPDQKDIVRLPVLAGRDQVTPAGTLSDKTRAETLDALAGICASKERWTLTWWDETPDWDVIPLAYEATEIEPEHVPGAGAAVAWLALQRL